MLRLLASLCLAFACAAAQAATYYVTQAGAGSANGSSLANAWSAAAFNTSGNWSSTVGTSGKISPGDTVSLNGTISTALAVQGAGTFGNVITIQFAAGASLSRAFWTGQALYVNKDYVTVDGNSVGIIECTANGTNLANQVDCGGIVIENASNVTVQNLIVRNIYVRVAGTDAHGYGSCIFLSSSSTSCNNITVTGCTLSNASNGLVGNFGSGCTNWTFTNNDVGFCNWSINSGDRGGASDAQTGLVIRGNTLHDWANWNQPNNDYHHNGVFIYVNGAGSCTSPVVDGNTFGPGFGGVNQTSGIYMNSGIYSPLITNNIFKPASGESAQNGMIALSSYYSTSFNIYNNTFVQLGSGGPCIRISGLTGTTTTMNIRNNITTGAWFYNIDLSANGGTLVNNINHNQYYNAPTFSVGAGGETLAAWQGFGYDADAITTNPLLDGTYHLGSGSPAIGVGSNLSSIFTTDKAGASRTIPWDLGAYKFTGTSTTPTPNPSSIASTSTSATAITVVATTTTGGTGAIQYNHAINGTYQGLQASPSRTFTGLTPSTSYAFKVKAQDSATIPNTTTESAVSNVSTTGTVPTVSSVTVPSAGTTIVVGLSASCTTGTGGSGGFTATVTAGAALTVSSVAGSGSSTYTLTTNRVILATDVFKLNYAQPGNGIEATVGGADLASFTLRTVTNNSTQVAATAPTLTSVTIPPAGTSFTLNFDQAVTFGAGGNTGLTVVASGGAMTLTYLGTGSTSLVYTPNPTANSGETIQISYTQPGNGIEGAVGGLDLASFTGRSVVNGSTAGIPTTTPTPPAPDRQPKPKKKR